MKHFTLIKSMILFMVVLSVFSIVTYAWIIATFKSDPIIVESGTLTVTSNFFIADDDNKDGILNPGSTYTAITTGGLSFDNAIPGETYTYRLAIKNTGNTDGFLTLKVNDIIATNPALLNLLSLHYTNPITTSSVELDLDSLTLDLFKDHILIAGQTLTLNFTIHIKPTINDNLQNESIAIGHFEVILNQIANQ